MSRHLTSEEFSEWLAGERTRGVSRHLEECSTCAAEIARFNAALSELGESVREWSNEEMGPETGTITKLRHIPYRAAANGLGLAFAVLMLCLAVHVGSTYVSTRQQVAAAPEISDELLFKQVDAAVGRTVAPSMEPLTGIAFRSSRDHKVN